jgi:hypothetical protein
MKLYPQKTFPFEFSNWCPSTHDEFQTFSCLFLLCVALLYKLADFLNKKIISKETRYETFSDPCKQGDQIGRIFAY